MNIAKLATPIAALFLAVALALCPGFAAAAQLPVITGANGVQEAVPVFPVPPTVPLTGASGNQPNASAAATLTATATTTVFLTGFRCTASGATTGLPTLITITGLAGGTLTYVFVFPAGVLVAATPVGDSFNPPLPASAVNTNVVVTNAAGGTGNTNSACVATGFRY